MTIPVSSAGEKGDPGDRSIGQTFKAVSYTHLDVYKRQSIQSQRFLSFRQQREAMEMCIRDRSRLVISLYIDHLEVLCISICLRTLNLYRFTIL